MGTIVEPHDSKTSFYLTSNTGLVQSDSFADGLLRDFPLGWAKHYQHGGIQARRNGWVSLWELHEIWTHSETDNWRDTCYTLSVCMTEISHDT